MNDKNTNGKKTNKQRIGLVIVLATLAIVAYGWFDFTIYREATAPTKPVATLRLIPQAVNGPEGTYPIAVGETIPLCIDTNDPGATIYLSSSDNVDLPFAPLGNYQPHSTQDCARTFTVDYPGRSYLTGLLVRDGFVEATAHLRLVALSVKDYYKR